MAIDVCIRGAGVVGKALALLLARARIRVGLVQTTSSHSTAAHAQRDIRAFALNAASQAMLSSLRAWPEGACAVQRMQVHGDGTGASASAVQFEASAMDTEALAWIVDASALEERLQAAVSFAPEITLLSAPEPAALTVICEGRTSASREAAGLHYDQTAYDQTAIAALVHTTLPHQATARQWMQGGEVCALLPRNTLQQLNADGGNSVALVWSVQHDHAQQLLALDEAQFCTALQLACGNALGDMHLDSQRAAWPLYLAQASRWVGLGLGEGLGAATTGAPSMPQGAWALAGDAAHAMHPLAGQGLNLGLGDAAELSRVLAAKEYFRSYGDMRLLRRYERARKGDAAALRVATDGLQRLFALDDERARSLRNWGMRGFEALAPVKSAVMRRAMGRL
jgi:2-polyprenyl-6-methoxyphenol hydroxylase-like FAD-dependent oxidoreductase